MNRPGDGQRKSPDYEKDALPVAAAQNKPMNSYKRNLVYQISYQVISLLVPLFLAPYTARVLGADRMGMYSYTYTAAYFFSIFSMLGIGNHGQRQIAACQNDKERISAEFWNIAAIQFACSFLCTGAYALYVFCFCRQYRLLYLLQGIFVSSSFINFEWLYAGMERFRQIAFRNTIVRLAAMAAVFVFVKSANDIWSYTLIMAGSVFLSYAVFLIGINNYVAFRRPDRTAVLRNLKPICVLFIPQIAITLFMYTDKIMLGAMSGMEQLGFYDAAVKIVSIPMDIIMAVGAVTMPRIASMKARGQEQEIRTFNNLSMHLMLMGGMAAAFGLTGIAADFIPTYFGPAYQPAVRLLQALSFVLPFMAWENVLQKQFLIPTHKDMAVVWSTLGAALTNIILNALLIPHFAAYGAILATVASHLILSVEQAFCVGGELPVRKYLVYLLPCAACGAVMLIAVFLLSRLGINVIIRIIIEIIAGAVVYCGLSLLTLRWFKFELSGTVRDAFLTWKARRKSRS